MKEHSIQGEIAIVTGSDSGIGQATAIAFAREGADVAITYLDDQQEAEHTRQQVEAVGRKAVVVHLDQRQPDQVEHLFTHSNILQTALPRRQRHSDNNLNNSLWRTAHR